MQITLHKIHCNCYKINLAINGIQHINFDKYFHIQHEENERNQIYIYKSQEKVCIIFGKIFTSEYRKGSMYNPARTYLNKYVNLTEEFLLIAGGKFLLMEYDLTTHTLLIVRDILGLQHAYYSDTSEGFFLSTSILSVLKFRKEEKNSINPVALNLYFMFQYLPQPYTMFNDIHQVPLQKILIYKNGQIIHKNSKYKYVDMLSRHTYGGSKDLISILAQSFKRQLNFTSKNNIGAMLSGGMDTSANVAILATELGLKPTVFTASFKEQEYDETLYAKIMAEKYNLKHKILIIKSNIVEDLPKITSFFDNPIADRAILPEYLICKLAKDLGIDVMISGEGGDEVLGYPRNLPERMQFKKEHFDNENLSEFYYSISALLPKDYVNDLVLNYNNTANDYLPNLYRNLKGLHPFEKIYYGQWQTWLIDNVLMKDTQLFDNFSMKFVSPYIDIPLMKHCLKLTANQKRVLLRNKSYLKNTLLKLLPDSIINKPKHKFGVPIAEWLRTELYEQVHDTLLSNDSITNSYFNKKLIKKMLENHKSGKIDYNRPLWALLFFENWYIIKKKYL